MPLFFKHCRGSTNGFVDPINSNHVWFVIHFKENSEGNPLEEQEFYHMLVVLDRTT